MPQHALAVCPHAKQHRYSLINRQPCQPVISETPRGKSRDGYTSRVRQGPTQILQYSTIKRPLGDCSVKVDLDSRDSGSTAQGHDFFHDSSALAWIECWRRELIAGNTYYRHEHGRWQDLQRL